MTAPPITDEEHTARAMLLGLEYDHRTMTYYHPSGDNEVDAVTLEVLERYDHPVGNVEGDRDEIRRRMRAWDATCTDESEKFGI